MIEQAQRHGAQFHFETSVFGIEPLGDRVRVAHFGGSDEADAVVVAAGSWVASVLAGIVDLPPIRVTQESVVHCAPRESLSWWPSFIHDGTPCVDGLETPGLGVKLAEHHTGPEVDPSTRDGVVDPGSRERIVQFVEQRMPGLVPVPVDEVTCLYTTTPNEEFVIDRVGPIVVASPCSGHGFKFAPLVGRMIADVVDGDAGPERFRLRR